jgi:glyoxylase-like metal-dependent hydrolase (beta-lactamase superfamily II)
VLATPGHTPDSLSLSFPGVVFTGDALFAGSVGGTGSPRNASQQIEAIRKHIFALPDDYEIHPGHGPASTVAVERGCNPFFA